MPSPASPPTSPFRRIALIAVLLLGIVGVGVAAAYVGGAFDPPPPATGAPLFKGDKHPLDDAIAYAEQRREQMQQDVRGYTGNLTKRERFGDKLLEEQMEVKVLNRRTRGEEIVTPFSVYLKFIAPAAKKGREVIYVENRDEGKLVAHEGGLFNIMRAKLEPDGQLAMMGNRYPLTDIGLDNLAVKLVERGKVDRKWGAVEVEMRDATGPDDRPCKLIEIRHPEQWPEFDFYLARIFIDEELNVPVRYSAYTWPVEPDGDPVLEEEYIYTNLKLNPGLTAADFDPDNKAYSYP